MADTSPTNRSILNPSLNALAEPVARTILTALAPYEVEVDEPWRAGTDRDEIYPSECYYQSVRYINHRARPSEQAWVVHGENALGHNGHAWVELPDGVVFDGVLQRFYRWADYERTTAAWACYKYDKGAAVLLPFRLSRHPDGTWQYGDWHVPLALPVATRGHPPMEVTLWRAADILTERGYIPPSAPSRKRKTRRRS